MTDAKETAEEVMRGKWKERKWEVVRSSESEKAKEAKPAN